MIALISPAKTMRNELGALSELGVCSEPRFEQQTQRIVEMMLRYSAVELAEIFRVSAAIAKELKGRFADFVADEGDMLAAVDAYDGIVYKHFKDEVLGEEQAHYLQKYLRISSLMYGLLRPFDLVKPYRMEGFVRLADTDERVDRTWRDLQTQTLIKDVQNEGGVLLYLASKEEQNAFHWREIKKSIRVIDFQFLQHKGDKLKQVVIYTKMARGEMLRYMTKKYITDPQELKLFEWGGYTYNDALSTDDVWTWVMEQN